MRLHCSTIFPDKEVMGYGFASTTIHEEQSIFERRAFTSAPMFLR
jgi:hypothetical protein